MKTSAVMECADAAHGLNGHIISDGGCHTPGDVAKAFGGGADFVMMGGKLTYWHLLLSFFFFFYYYQQLRIERG